MEAKELTPAPEQPLHEGMSRPLPPFEEFFAQNRDRVWRLLVALVGPDAAEDCFQETFLSAMRGYPRLRDDSNLAGWAMTIARRKATDHWRAHGRRPIPIESLEEVGAVSDEPKLSGVVWPMVRELPDKQRTAVALRYAADLTHGEIASIMKTTEEAARQNVHQGLSTLRKRADAAELRT